MDRIEQHLADQAYFKDLAERDRRSHTATNHQRLITQPNHVEKNLANQVYWRELAENDKANMRALHSHHDAPVEATPVEYETQVQKAEPLRPVLPLQPEAVVDDLTTADGMMSSVIREAALDDTGAIAYDDLPAVDPMHARALAMYPKSYREHLLKTDMRALIAHDALELETGRSAVELLAPDMLQMLAFQNADSVIERAQKLDTATKRYQAACNAIRAGKDKRPMPCLADIYEQMFGPLGAA